MKDDLMVKLKPEFQRELFNSLLKKYNRTDLSKLLNKSSSILYHYKNCRVNNIPLNLLEIAIKLLNISKEEFNKNIIDKFSAKDKINKILNNGREIRKNKIKEYFNINIQLKEFIIKKREFYYIDTKKWLDKTKWIEKISNQKGFIKNVKEPKIEGNNIILEYETYSKNKKCNEKFINNLPLKIKIDEEFLYFLGIRYGDGTSGCRIGIVNKNLDLIKNVAIYLRKTFQISRLNSSIYLYKNVDLNSIENFKIELSKISDKLDIYDARKSVLQGDYVLCIFITNSLFNKIYNTITNQLKEFFNILNFKQKGAFLAGFFDAEGNVNKLDRNLRWSQKIEHKVIIIKEILIAEGYHVRYDGSNLIIAHKKEFSNFDLDLFKRQVLPFVKHPERRKEAIELLNGYLVRDCYKNLVNIIAKNPGINNYGMAKIVKRIRNQRELSALTDAGFLKRERKKVDESFKYFVTEKGINWIMESN